MKKIRTRGKKSNFSVKISLHCLQSLRRSIKKFSSLRFTGGGIQFFVFSLLFQVYLGIPDFGEVGFC